MPKQTKKNNSRKNFLKPYFAPSGSRPGVQIRLPSNLPRFSRSSVNTQTGNKPGSIPSNSNSSTLSGWNAFDKYAGRALLVGTGAHLAYQGGKYIQQRFVGSQGRNFAQGQEPQIPRVEDPVQGEFLPDEVEMGYLNVPRIQNAGVQGFNIEAPPVAQVGDVVVERSAAVSEGFFARMASAVGNFFKNAAGDVENVAEESLPLLEEGAEEAGEAAAGAV